jgi:hypothetical protein
LFSFLIFFETFFQIAQRPKAMVFVFANPALVDLVQGHWIQIMQLLASVPDNDHQVPRFQQGQMLGDCLTGHVEMSTQLGQCLPVVLAQLI